MTEQQATLQRSLSLPLTPFYGLGNILGAGVCLLSGKIAWHARVYAPVALVTAALLGALTTLSYAELSARFPLSANLKAARALPPCAKCLRSIDGSVRVKN